MLISPKACHHRRSPDVRHLYRPPAGRGGEAGKSGGESEGVAGELGDQLLGLSRGAASCHHVSIEAMWH